MKGSQLAVILLGSILIATSTPNAEASAFLILVDTSREAKFCDTSLAINVINCSPAAGFVTSMGGNSIFFSGTIGGFSISALSVTGNQPGVSTGATVIGSLTNVLKNSGVGNLQVDFGGNNFTAPLGPSLFLSASATGNWGQSETSDTAAFSTWGRVDNALLIGGDGGPSAIAPICMPGAGLTTSCTVATNGVPFTRGLGNYALTARFSINQSTADVLGASYTGLVAASSQTTTVHEPGSVVMLGGGMLLFAVFRRLRKDSQ